jgi:hypothetical protein
MAEFLSIYQFFVIGTSNSYIDAAGYFKKYVSDKIPLKDHKKQVNNTQCNEALFRKTAKIQEFG